MLYYAYTLYNDDRENIFNIKISYIYHVRDLKVNIRNDQ